MNATTNQALCALRRRQALLCSGAGIAILVAGLVLNLRNQFAAAYLALLLGTICSWVGVVLADRWVAIPRPDRVLAEGLKRCTGRPYHLYNWTLPPDHVLLAPWGLTVFHALGHDGPALIDGDRWRDQRPLWRRLLRFARRPVRHPGELAALDVKALREALAAKDAELAAVPIDTVVLFTHPQAKLTLLRQDEALPVLRPADLDAWAQQSLRDRPRLAPALRLRLEELLRELKTR